ncbi:hypothetical protein BRC90_08435 [Halobacteriales archaeon QS_4_69_34]|nr:MAG: hypothetical protein BRC90_08435 [Halobacteriales archaeon QS_4_69_34]
MRRRRFLAAAVTAGVLAGCSGSDAGRTADSTTRAPSATAERTSVGAEGQIAADTEGRTDATETVRETARSADGGSRRDDFLWAEQALWRDERVRENLFAYAGRHDLTAVIAQANANRADVGAVLREPLAAAREHGIEAWVNTGVLSRITAAAFVADAEKRATHLDRLGRAAAVYGEFFPEGRLVVWQEAPVGGEWIEGGAWNDRAREKMRELGPEVFAAQRQAIAAAAPDVDVGIFVHFPYIVDSKRPEVFAALCDELDSRGALPDFAFVDFYRGWYEKTAGPATANDAVTSLVTNAREGVRGRDVLYLGGDHTINPKHTPAKQSLRMDLRASTGAGADGLGWYARTNYRPTEQGFDPFVPNTAAPATVNGTSRASTVTFARDRYQYAYAALFETRAGFDPARRFDLWLAGTDVGFYDHRLSLRARSGEWVFVGDFSGYLGGTYPPDSGGSHVSIFRALDRGTFLGAADARGHDAGTATGRAGDGGTLKLEIETADESADATLASALVVPFDVGAYVSEPEATALLGEREIGAFALGEERVDASLEPGASLRLDVAVADAAQRPLDALVNPGHGAVLERLRDAEASAGFDPGARFDLWIEAAGLDALERPAERLYLADGGTRQYVADAAVASSAAPGGAAFYGLDRSVLPDRLGGRDLAVEGDRRDGREVELKAAYAMPYFGSRNFVSAARALELVAGAHLEARTFSLDYADLSSGPG